LNQTKFFSFSFALHNLRETASDKDFAGIDFSKNPMTGLAEKLKCRMVTGFSVFPQLTHSHNIIVDR
jgi:hypothetical protein